jgi:ADP-heptose:LPS heptosyltransferase
MSGSPILAIRPRALGDVVLTTPALRALARSAPDVALEVVTDARYVPLLESAPGVRRVWPLGGGTLETARLIAALRRRRYALAVDFFGNPRSAWITALSGARDTAGYDLRGRRHAYRIRVPRSSPPAGSEVEYAADAHLRLAVAVGGRHDGRVPRFDLSSAIRAEAARELARAGVDEPAGVVGLIPAGTRRTKTWPLSHGAMLARGLVARGIPVIAIAGPGEEAALASFARLAPEVPVLGPCRDVAILAGVIARLRAIVGTDSGPRHLAIAFGVPTFTWFGPADPRTWTPSEGPHGTWWTDLPCRACHRDTCPHWNCMPGLDPSRAIELVVAHLERHERTTPDLGPAARA